MKPHCDDLVLHAPGECQYCDAYPARQQERVDEGIAFSGHDPEEGQVPCPSEQRRPREVIERWRGNQAQMYGSLISDLLRVKVERILKQEIGSAFQAGWDARGQVDKHDLEVGVESHLSIYLAGCESRWDVPDADPDEPCKHPARAGRHEWYLIGQKHNVCRACGAQTKQPTETGGLE